MNCGGIFLGNAERYIDKVLPLFDDIGIPYEVWALERLRRHFPGIDVGMYAPPKRFDDDAFCVEAAKPLESVVYSPAVGYITDPQLVTHNLQRAAEAKGGSFCFGVEVVDIRIANGCVRGIILSDGTEIDAGIVVNVAGPHSSVINRMAGVDSSMNITTRALRYEIHYIPSPDFLDFENSGSFVDDDDLGTYFRPEVGNNILLGSQDLECDSPKWIDNLDDFNRRVTSDQWQAQVLRLARRWPAIGVPGMKKGVVDL